MSWFFFAISTAFLESLRDIFNKKTVSVIDEYILVFSFNLLTAIFASPLLFFNDIPALGDNFFYALIAIGVFNTIAFVLFFKAIKASDLSIVAPITTLSPIFLLITSPFIVGEFPNAIGILGIFIIVIGAYVLKFQDKTSGYLAPFKSLFKETGSRLMFGVVLVWSITANVDKIGVQNSSPIFWTITAHLSVALFILPIVFLNSKPNIQNIKSNFKNLILIGFINTLAILCQMSALQLALVSFVIAVKRTSALFNVLWGWLIFKEQGIKERIAGSMIMILGVVVITLSKMF
ncbi:putative membrane protein [Rivularia sp. PCC 7116]|uniref:EamA family transporter n=1 Tax=Rivularia sp. PCC 7116 TaxID=373994 RepID=UPI00029EFA20|nr:DMT family transporter [Rivularia sp. PCC 7116]AFY55889.1 putative membrane protein [Rivularia sp. PCC 7116]